MSPARSLASHRPAPVPPQPPELTRGTCVTHPDPHLWESPAPADRASAQALCPSCPVLAHCRAWALAHRTADDLVTVLGGLTPYDRRRLRTGRQRALTSATAARLPSPSGRACSRS
jgi:WhiB family transcriptional regulator, redox-sensing transcriptional regulator